jgi:hypothetical protein
MEHLLRILQKSNQKRVKNYNTFELIVMGLGTLILKFQIKYKLFLRGKIHSLQQKYKLVL